MSLKKWLTLSIALMVLGVLLAVVGYFGIGVLMAIGLVPLPGVRCPAGTFPRKSLQALRQSI